MDKDVNNVFSSIYNHSKAVGPFATKSSCMSNQALKTDLFNIAVPPVSANLMH